MKKVKEEQNKLWDLIYQMKKKTGKKKSRRRKFENSSTKMIINLVKTVEIFYQIRNKVINLFE